MGNKLIFNTDNISEYYIDTFVREFLEKNIKSITDFSRSLYRDSSDVSLSAFQEIVLIELKKACYSFVNNNKNPEDINKYLFATINKTIKGLREDGKKIVYICPACKYNSNFEILKSYPKKVVCNVCQNILNSTKEKWEDLFYSTFAEHGRKGYRCKDCNNFIPESLSSISEDIICPYPDCFFVGNVSDLKIMRHPFMKANLEIASLKDNPKDEFAKTDTEIIVKEDINEYLYLLDKCINEQIALVKYKSNESTIISKLCMYAAYQNMIKKYPEDMISYLIHLNSAVKIQHLIFQEFVSITESKIPYSYMTNGRFVEIKSILDEELGIFNGTAIFNAVVNEKNEIPNLTEDLYVGGRKGVYCKPYYIGKVLDVFDINNNVSILNYVDRYSFFRINMKNTIEVGTNVRVIHAKIPPHYSMGSMVYLNRIRRSIVDKVYYSLNGEKRKITP
jgi:hypothetical protein